MSNAVYTNAYNLKKGVSVPDFLLAVEQLINEHVSKQKGYVSFQLLSYGEAWRDYLMFETMDDLIAFEESSRNNRNELAEKFYSFLNFFTMQSNVYSVKVSY